MALHLRRFSAPRLAYTGTPSLPVAARRHAHWFYTAVVCLILMIALATWRFAVASQGIALDDTWDAIGWLHRTFVLTVVYVCGSAILGVR